MSEIFTGGLYVDNLYVDNAPVGETIVSVRQVASPVKVPAARYTDPAWAEVEVDTMWSSTWQLACSLDHVKNPGDVFVYEIGVVSILIVRGSDGELRAFQNTCLHRGSELCDDHRSGLTEIRCPFHRWSWDLEGQLREVPSRKGFGALRNDELPLIPASVDSWGPMVFVNPSADAEPLADFLDPVPAESAWSELDDFRCKALLTIPVKANWKTIIDGFSETYHVQGIHPEMLRMVDDVNSPQVIWDRHGRLTQPYGVASPRIRGGATNQEIWEGFVEVMGGRLGIPTGDDAGECPPVPDGQTLRDVLAGMIRTHFHETEGVDLSQFDTTQMMTMEQYNLFPNITVLIFGDLLQVVRSRPGPTPDDGFLEIMAFDRVDSGAARRDPITMEVAAGSYSMGLVVDQDIENVERSHRGLHAPGLRHLTLSGEECRIINLHRNLDRVTGVDSGMQIDYRD